MSTDQNERGEPLPDIGICTEEPKGDGALCGAPATWLLADVLCDPPEAGWHAGRCDRCIAFYATHLRVSLGHPMARKIAQAQQCSREAQARAQKST